MSDKKNLQDDIDDVINNAKETAKEFTENAKETFSNSSENKKILAGIIAIIFGWIGIHKFLLGYNKEGVILLVLGVLGFFTCGVTSAISGIIGLIEGVVYLTKTDYEFYNTYQVGYKAWF